jgi:hypothetical protein
MSVFENRVLRRIFGPKRNEVTGEWRTLHKEELNDLYSSPNIVRVIKSRRIRWMGLVARMWQSRGIYRVWWGTLRKGEHLEDPGVNGRIIIKCFFSKWVWGGGIWTGSNWLRIGTGGAHV